MNHYNLVFASMRPGCVYRATDVAKETGLDTSEAGRILNSLAKGGLVERMRGGEFARKYLYATKQRELFNAAAQE